MNERNNYAMQHHIERIFINILTKVNTGNPKLLAISDGWFSWLITGKEYSYNWMRQNCADCRTAT